MDNIYEKIKDPEFSTHIYARKGGENRAKDAITAIFDKIIFGEQQVSNVKCVFLRLTSGESEITIDEIGEVNDAIQKEFGGTNIIMSVHEKDISDDIEVQLIITSLEFDSEKVDVEELFNISNPIKESLSLYFLEDEYSSDEISEIISFVSDLYQDIGGDELKIRGFQSKLVEINLEPTLF